MGRSLAPQPCIRLDPCGPDHEAVIRFEGEAPSWWAHSADGVIADTYLDGTISEIATRRSEFAAIVRSRRRRPDRGPEP